MRGYRSTDRNHGRAKGAGNMQIQVATFAAKVRYGSGSRFDPMMEEKGGWIVGEAPKQDVEISEVEIKIIAEASQHISDGELNPFKEQVGEMLPTNLERNFSGFFGKKISCQVAKWIHKN